MHLADLLDREHLEADIASGYLRATPSQDGRVIVYNYTEKAQYEPHWCAVTRNCRGLVTDPHGNLLARGFPKFFNLHDHAEGNRHGLPPIPGEPPVDVAEKVDGSLGILVHDGEKWRIVTRGSADSEQAKYATANLMEPLWQNGWQPEPGVSYLFEIVYPANRIVVDYGSTEELVFLAALDTETGRDVEVEPPPVEWAKTYGTDVPVHELPGQVGPEDEGYVVRWPGGLRVKVKGAEYVRLHAIVTMVSSKTVWEHLSTGRPLDELLDRVPDEFEKWLRATINDLCGQHTALIDEACDEFRDVCRTVWGSEHPPSEIDREARKAFAAVASRSELRAALFQILDGKSPDRWAWLQIKPEYARPFTSDVEEPLAA
jgi:RNA ligase